jgi:hypothetical protein
LEIGVRAARIIFANIWLLLSIVMATRFKKGHRLNRHSLKAAAAADARDDPADSGSAAGPSEG